MDEFRTENSTYSPQDFLMWETNQTLSLTPKFQRRSVWKAGAKSFFIDTILRGMTVPPIYLRNTQNEEKTKSIREVVDGQQRIRTVLDFIKDGGFRLSRSLKADWSNKRFIDLTQAQQRQIKDFGFSCESFKGISDQQVLEVFSRLNMYGVPLNKQELRNGKYFGEFKQCCYAMAHDYLEFWRKHKIFTEMSIARMLEVELVSEILIAGNNGMQDGKTSIDGFYDQWENDYPHKTQDEKRFTEIMRLIDEIFSDDTLKQTEFRRPPLFYTLYCVIYHFMYGLPDVQRTSPKRKFTADNRQELNDAVRQLSSVLVESKETDSTDEPPAKYKKFVLACSRHTDDTKARTERFNTLYETAF